MSRIPVLTKRGRFFVVAVALVSVVWFFGPSIPKSEPVTDEDIRLMWEYCDSVGIPRRHYLGCPNAYHNFIQSMIPSKYR